MADIRMRTIEAYYKEHGMNDLTHKNVCLSLGEELFQQGKLIKDLVAMMDQQMNLLLTLTQVNETLKNEVQQKVGGLAANLLTRHKGVSVNSEDPNSPLGEN